MDTKVTKADVTKTEATKTDVVKAGAANAVKSVVEVWARDNYEFYSGDSDNEVKIASFASTEAAINFIKKKLDEHIHAQLKRNANNDNLSFNHQSIEDLLAGYRFGGTNYFIKIIQPCGLNGVSGVNSVSGENDNQANKNQQSRIEFDTSFNCKKYVEQQLINLACQ